MQQNISTKQDKAINDFSKRKMRKIFKKFNNQILHENKHKRKVTEISAELFRELAPNNSLW